MQCYYLGKMLANQNMEVLHVRELYVYMAFRLKNTNLNIMPCSWKTKAASLNCFSCKPWHINTHFFSFAIHWTQQHTHCQMARYCSFMQEHTSSFWCGIPELLSSRTWLPSFVFLLHSGGNFVRCWFCMETMVLLPRNTDCTHCSMGLPRVPDRRKNQTLQLNCPG